LPYFQGTIGTTAHGALHSLILSSDPVLKCEIRAARGAAILLADAAPYRPHMLVPMVAYSRTAVADATELLETSAKFPGSGGTEPCASILV